MDIFLVNEDNEACRGLIKKLCDANGREGAIIPLDAYEMELYRSDDFQVLKLGSDESSDSSLSLTQVEPGKHYVIACKESHVNIDDIVRIADRLHVNISIVRTK